jgi:hypothetical protein
MRVYPRPYFETDDSLTVFYFFLRHPYGDAQLGNVPNCTVRYFDDESVFDAEWSYPAMQGIRRSD